MRDLPPDEDQWSGEDALPFDPLEAARRRFEESQQTEQGPQPELDSQVKVKPPLRAVGKDERPPPKSCFTWIESVSLAAPLPPIPWVCEGLEFAPGAPLLWAGYGGGGKSMCAQWLALSVAAGIDFGNLAVRQGKVLHMDYEQGSYVTAHRYQRMAAARGLQLGSLPIRAAIYPKEGLTHPASEKSLMLDCEGATMCIVDSLAVGAAGTDENSTEMRRPIDMLSRVSEATGCAFFVIHHARKTQAGVEDGDVRMTIRGSSGIFDACASVFALVGRPGTATKVHHLKARVRGKLQPEMELSLVDTEEGFLEVQISAAATEDLTLSDYDRCAPRILEFLQNNPGSPKESILARVRGKKQGLQRTLYAMHAEGTVTVAGAGKKGDAKLYYVYSDS